MRSSRATSIVAWCRRLAKNMERTWQCLPRSSALNAPPIAIRTTLAVHDGHKAPETPGRPFPSPHAGIEAALREADPPVVILLGNPGCGKSTALRWTARESASRVVGRRRSGREPVPIPVDLSKWETDYADCSELNGILDKSRPGGIGSRRPVIWFLDGLDFLPISGRLAAAAVVHDAHERAGDSERFVFSTRPMVSVDIALGELGTTWRLTLEPLARNDREEWVQKHCAEAARKLSDFERRYPQHVGFLDVPLLFAMVLSTCLDKQLKWKAFRWDIYPGRAGLFKGFVTYMLNRRIRDKRQIRRYGVRYARVVEGVFWSALVSDEQRRSRQPCSIEDEDVGTYLIKAFGSEKLESSRRAWISGTEMLRKAGLIVEPANESRCQVLHPLFAEYWAAKHVAERLHKSIEHNWLEAELWDHLKEKRLDAVVAQGLGILSAGGKTLGLLQTAFDALRVYSLEDALSFATMAGSDKAARLVLGMMRGGGSPEPRTTTESSRGASQKTGKGRSKKDTREPDDARFKAALALGRFRNTRATDMLLEALNDPEPTTRRYAAMALGLSSSRRVVEPVLRLLEDPDEGVRIEAVETLGKTGSTEAIGPLMTLYAGASAQLRWCIVHALDRLDEDAACDILGPMLEDPNGSVRAKAVSDLGGLRSKKAMALLNSMLDDPDPRVRQCIAWSIASGDREEAVKPLLALLKDREPEVRHAAVKGLGRVYSPGRLDPSPAVKPVLAMLTDSVYQLRLEAVETLRWLRSKEAAKPLIRLLKHKDDAIRDEAELALLLMGNKRAIDATMRGLDSATPRVRKSTVVRLACLESRRAAAKILTGLLKHPDKVVRKTAVVALAWRGGRGAVKPLMPLLNDPDTEVRTAAVRAIGIRHGRQAANQLRDMLSTSKKGERLHEQVVLALGGLGIGADRLVALLGHKDDATRADAALALSELVRKGQTSLYDIEAAAKTSGIPPSEVREIAYSLDMRLEPPDARENLAEQRRKRAMHSNGRDVVRAKAEETTPVDGATAHNLPDISVVAASRTRKAPKKKKRKPKPSTRWLEDTPKDLHPSKARTLWKAALKLCTFTRKELQDRSDIGEGPAKRFLRYAEDEGKLRTNRDRRRSRQEAIVYTVVGK